MLPELEHCGEDSRRLGKTFLEYSEDLRRIYCRSVTWPTPQCSVT